MPLRKLYITAFFLVGCGSTSAASSPGCGTLAPCSTANGIAVLAPPDIAAPLLSTAQEGAAQFKRYFGEDITPLAIIPGGTITKDMRAELEQTGFMLSLPWMSGADKKALEADNVRRQVLEQTEGMPLEQQEAIVKMTLAKLGGEAASPNMSATEEGALTHELGHLWFMAAFQPQGGHAAVKGHGYGGWAPDWLDETAAVLLENDTLTENRRKAFATIATADLYPLQTFLTMEHPALKSAQALKAKMGNTVSKGESRAIVLSGDEAEAFLKDSKAGDPSVFYTQVRGFADFIITETGDERIFAKLAETLAWGGTLQTWLAEAEGLPASQQALESEWDNWLSER